MTPDFLCLWKGARGETIPIPHKVTFCFCLQICLASSCCVGMGACVSIHQIEDKVTVGAKCLTSGCRQAHSRPVLLVQSSGRTVWPQLLVRDMACTTQATHLMFMPPSVSSWNASCYDTPENRVSPGIYMGSNFQLDIWTYGDSW